jgi:hypothetical protein
MAIFGNCKERDIKLCAFDICNSMKKTDYKPGAGAGAGAASWLAALVGLAAFAAGFFFNFRFGYVPATAGFQLALRKSK